MKKLILKTALITFGLTLIFGITLFGIVSFFAPASMMNFFESLGLESIGGDYAYQEYQNTSSLAYLAHSFELAADRENFYVADERFEELYGEANSERREAFEKLCAEQDKVELPEGMPQYKYRAYLCARAACVKYRLALTNDAKNDVCAFALAETDEAVSDGSPVIALTLEAYDAQDASFCSLLLEKFRADEKFDTRSENYKNIVKFLEDGSGREAARE